MKKKQTQTLKRFEICLQSSFWVLETKNPTQGPLTYFFLHFQLHLVFIGGWSPLCPHGGGSADANSLGTTEEDHEVRLKA